MFSINCAGRLLVLDKPIVMGIINTTPDSFYAGSREKEMGALLSKAEGMLEDGAAILDIGGQSTRPGSTPVHPEEERTRVLPAIEAICRRFPEAIVSVDTYYAPVAEGAIAAGASIVNDVSAGTLDPGLLPLVARSGVAYVLMHMKGHPQTMQEAPRYEDVVTEVFDFLSYKIRELRELGIHDIIADPGFGFGKTIAHNFTLLKNLSFFRHLDVPVLAGLSRKGTVYRTLDVTPEEALNGTTVVNTLALMNGAGILRVHDVKEAVQAIRLLDAYDQ
jgi:dihydropteroate synthase